MSSFREVGREGRIKASSASNLLTHEEKMFQNQFRQYLELECTYRLMQLFPANRNIYAGWNLDVGFKVNLHALCGSAINLNVVPTAATASTQHKSVLLYKSAASWRGFCWKMLQSVHRTKTFPSEELMEMKKGQLSVFNTLGIFFMQFLSPVSEDLWRASRWQ